MEGYSKKGEIPFPRIKQLARVLPLPKQWELVSELCRSFGASERLHLALGLHLGYPEMRAWAQIQEKQSLLPGWALRNAQFHLRKKSDGALVYTIELFKKMALEEGMYWERNANGSKQLVHRDPDTGEESIVIHYSVPDTDRVAILQAEVDTASLQVTFVQETALADLDPGDFELYWE